MQAAAEWSRHAESLVGRTGLLRAFPLRSSVVEPGRDDSLVAAAQADAAQFDAVYDRYYAPVFRYLAAKASSQEEAADLTQAVFLKAFDGLSRYRVGATPFASWLFRIARNTAVDAHRRQKPAVSWEVVPDVQPAVGDSPEEQLLRMERLTELRSALRALNAEKRELLALRYAGGLTVAETAPLVGKNPDAVKKQLQRTLRELKEQTRDSHE